jgi:HSP20 family protein
MFPMVPWWKNEGGRELASPFEVMPREFRALFNRLFAGFPVAERFEWPAEYFWKTEVKEGEKEVVVRAEVPGFEEEEFEVNLSGERLHIKAEHRKEEKKEKEYEFTEERRYERMIELPATVTVEKAEASYHNGVLEIRLPKTEVTVARKIPVTKR